MGLAKALGVIVSSGLKAAADVKDEQTKKENDWTKVGVVRALDQIDIAKKESKAKVEKNMEMLRDVQNLSGTLQAIDDTTKETRNLTKAEIGQLLQVMTKEQLLKYTMDSKSPLITVAGNAVESSINVLSSETDSILATTQNIGKGLGDDKDVGFFARGQGDRISKQINSMVGAMNLSTDPVDYTVAKFEGGTFKFNKEEEPLNIATTLVAEGTMNGKFYPDIVLGQTSEGEQFIIDPRFTKENGVPVLLSAEVANGITIKGKMQTVQGDATVKSQHIVPTLTIDGEVFKNALVIMTNKGDYVINDPKVPKVNGEFRKLESGMFESMTQVADATKVVLSARDTAVKSINPFLNKSFESLNKAFNTTNAARHTIKNTIDELADAGAMEPGVYSLAVTLTGGFLQRVEVEIAGIKSVTLKKENEDNQDRGGQLTKVQTYINNNSDTTDMAIKAKVLESRIFVAAVKQAQADGETRPSDKDIINRINMFSASSPAEFIEKAKVLVSNAEKTYQAARLQYQGRNNPAWNFVQKDLNSEDPKLREGAQYLKDIYFREDESSPEELANKFIPTILKDPSIEQKARSDVDTIVRFVHENGATEDLYMNENGDYYRANDPTRTQSLEALTAMGFTVSP